MAPTPTMANPALPTPPPRAHHHHHQGANQQRLDPRFLFHDRGEEALPAYIPFQEDHPRPPTYSFPSYLPQSTNKRRTTTTSRYKSSRNAKISLGLFFVLMAIVIVVSMIGYHISETDKEKVKADSEPVDADDRAWVRREIMLASGGMAECVHFQGERETTANFQDDGEVKVQVIWEA